MIHLGPFGAFRIILILIAIYYIARWWSRSQQQKRQSGPERDGSRYNRRSRKGDVTIEYTKDGRKKDNSGNTGDYVDFEEVE